MNGLRPIAALATLALVACADRPATVAVDQWSGTVDTIAGVVHIRNPETGLWRAGEEWRFVEELRIGAIDGDGPDVFSEISALAVSPTTGDIYVVDQQTQEIRVFDRDGVHRFTFGGSGSGPGELLNGYGVEWDGEGRFWVVDIGNQRYVAFSEAGEVLNHTRRPVTSFAMPWLGGIGADGYLYDLVPAEGPGGSVTFTFARVSLTGELLESLPPIVQPPRPRPLTSALLALLPRTTFRFDPAGTIWFGGTDGYRLIQRSLAGDTLRVVERAHTAQPVTAEERDSVAVGVAQLPPHLQSAAPEVPAIRPVLERIHTGADGHLYVQLYGGPSDRGRLFDVFDREGRYLGTAQSEVPFSTYRALPIFGQDHVHAITTDELGIDYVVRVRVERGRR